MAKALYLDSVAGVAGDMFAAAFVDAGLVSVDELDELALALGIRGLRVVADRVTRATVQATLIKVESVTDEWKDRFAGNGHSNRDRHEHDHHDLHHHQDHQPNTNLILDQHISHWHAHYRDIDRVIAGSTLGNQTQELARGIFRLIGEAEADVHGIPLNEAAFHELGTIDSIMDVVMAAHCITKVEADEIYASPIKPGRGQIRIAHGTHPVPPPASAQLLIGMQTAPTPAAVDRQNVELSTPTGIAIIKALGPHFVSEMPSGTLKAVGRGSGTRDLGVYPNVFQISLIETSSASHALPYETDEVTEIAFNVDDDTAEHIAWMCGKLLDMGALDVWQTPGTGKKGRSMVCVSILAASADFSSLADWILRNSTTFGIRYRKWSRLKLAREFEERELNGRRVRFKVGRTPAGEKLKEKPEFDDLNL